MAQKISKGKLENIFNLMTMKIQHIRISGMHLKPDIEGNS